jgi:hypothetical protein
LPCKGQIGRERPNSGQHQGMDRWCGDCQLRGRGLGRDAVTAKGTSGATWSGWAGHPVCATSNEGSGAGVAGRLRHAGRRDGRGRMGAGTRSCPVRASCRVRRCVVRTTPRCREWPARSPIGLARGFTTGLDSAPSRAPSRAPLRGVHTASARSPVSSLPPHVPLLPLLIAHRASGKRGAC